MTPEQTAPERERAFEAFERIFNVHRAALQVFGLVPSLPDAESRLTAQIKLAQVQRGNLGVDVNQTAAELLAIATAERGRGYETMRRLTLVSVCGALEYLVKAVLVDQVASDHHEAAALLSKSKIKFNASEVLGLTPSEQWFVIADRLFEQLADPHPLMHARSVRLLTGFAPFPFGDEQKNQVTDALTQDEIRCFNQAFLIRNCLVHNGGKVSSPLARFSGLSRGTLLSVDSRSGTAQLLAIRKFAQTINNPWLGSL